MRDRDDPGRTIIRALRLVAWAAPREIKALVVLNVLYGAGPTLLLYVGKVVIDEVSRLASGGMPNSFAQLDLSPRLLMAVAGFIVLTFILDAIETIRGLIIDNLRDRTTGEAKWRLIVKVAGLQDLSIFENPRALNDLQLAEQGTEHVWRLTTSLGRMFVGLVTFVPAWIFTAFIGWWVPFVLFLTAIPAVILQGRIEDVSWEVEKTQAGNVRMMKLCERILLTEIYAKEVRLFRLQNFFLQRWKALFGATFSAMRDVRVKAAGTVVGSSLVSALGAAIPYVFVIHGVLHGRYTVGDLALYAGVIFQVRRSLELLIYEGAETYRAALSVGPIFKILEVKSRLSPTPVPSGTMANSGPGIQFHGVRFTYPGSERPALDGIDLTISPGEVVVLVGENGAGKTTLTKLLCRLYDPDEGYITWDGQDLRAFPIDELRDKIVAVVQDYAHFPATARENIAFGDLSTLNDDGALREAAREAGLVETIDQLPRALDTPLGSMLEGGVDLSGGQWQRLAIARAIIRQPQAQLVVLDEPTAAIDPQSEYEVMQTLRRMARGKMALIVSHRLSLARMADRIVVLQNGRIVEEGTHEELMARKGLYHVMFTSQASHYV